MAEKKDSELIGFDPLAWMNDNKEEQPPVAAVPEETVSVDEKIANITEPTIEAPSEEVTEEVNVVIPPDEQKVILDSTHTIQNINGLYDKFHVLLKSQEIIEIDASAVMSIDTATLQLLIVLKQTAIKQGKEVVIDFPSDQFIEAAELLGLSEMLNVDQAAAGFF